MAAAVTTLRAATSGRLALPVVAIALGAMSIPVALRGGITTYAGMSSVAAAVDLAAGLGLILAGSFAWLERPSGSTGPVAVLLGLAWLAPDWVGWEGGAAFARSLGMLAAPFLLPLLVHLVLAWPASHLPTRSARVAVALVYGVAAVVSVGLALVRDPFLDPYCWRNCTDNVFLVRADQGTTHALEDLWLRFSVAAGFVLAAIAIWRLLGATRAGRAAQWAVLVPAALAAVAEAAYAVALLRDPDEGQHGAFRVLFFARALTLACLAAGIAWTVVRARHTRGAISRLAAELGEAPPPGSLQAALARSLGDDDLEVAYWLSGSGRYVDASGRSIDAPQDGDRVATPIVRGGEPVALVVHDRALAGARELEREIGAAARLAVDNERLRAEVLAQLGALRASRARIVETGDAARRRLERDLHDGAQQRLLALSYDLRIARGEAETDGDREAALLLAEATDEAQATLEELRDLAHGIYPAILTEAGLGPALASLADAAPIALELDTTPDRYAAGVETAVYVVVSEAIADAARRNASYAAVGTRRDGDRLVVTVEDDGSARATAMTHVTDRVGALGGRLEAGTGTLQAEIPCA